MLKDRQDLKKFREECVRSYNAYTRKILGLVPAQAVFPAAR